MRVHTNRRNSQKKHTKSQTKHANSQNIYMDPQKADDLQQIIQIHNKHVNSQANNTNPQQY